MRALRGLSMAVSWGGPEGASAEVAGGAPARRDLAERRILLGAYRRRKRAAVAEAAARERLAGIGHVAADRQRLARLVDPRHRHRLDERAGVGVLRLPAGAPRSVPPRRCGRDTSRACASRRSARARGHARCRARRAPARARTSRMHVEDARPDADVEHRDGLVGDQERRLEHERAREHDALQLAARELMREEPAKARQPRQPHARRAPSRSASRCSSPGDAGVDERLGERALDREARIDGVEGVLEHELRLPAEGAQPRPGERARAARPRRGCRRRSARRASAAGARSSSCRSRTRRGGRRSRPYRS